MIDMDFKAFVDEHKRLELQLGKATGQITGLTSGCFDLFHFSHLLYLQRCRSLCDRLIVAVDSDEMVKRAKGPRRPIIPEDERLELIRHLSFVSDTMILHNVEELSGIVQKHNVRKLFKHESFRNLDKVFGVDAGADLIIVPDIKGMINTTSIIARIIERYTGD